MSASIRRIREYLAADESGFDADVLDEVGGACLNRSDIRDLLEQFDRLTEGTI